MKLYEPATIAMIRQKYGFRLSKSLGQNFLTEKSVIDDIIAAAEIGPEDLVIEIGPGIGVLTHEACLTGARVKALEIDRALIPILSDTLAGFDNLEIIHADVLKTDMNAIIDNAGMAADGRVRIIGNLPYYITTPIIMKILEDGVRCDSVVIMMQKEVADRIKAKPGTKAYGALSVAVQYYCDVEKVCDVPRSYFVPQPNVDSAVLKLAIRKQKAAELKDEALFFECVKGGFGQRRKTLLNSLTGVRGITKEQAAEALARAGIDPSRRAETLAIEEFAHLADSVGETLR